MISFVAFKHIFACTFFITTSSMLHTSLNCLKLHKRLTPMTRLERQKYTAYMKWLPIYISAKWDSAFPYNSRLFGGFSFEERLPSLKRIFLECNERSLSNIKMVDQAVLLEKVKDLEAQTTEATFWDDSKNAQKITREITQAKKKIERIGRWKEWLGDVMVGMEYACDVQTSEDEKESFTNEVEYALQCLKKDLDAYELELLLSGPYDERAVRLSIQAGAGGTDAQDWAAMLLRMYKRFCEKKEYQVTVLEETPGEEAGIKGAVLEIHGENAFGNFIGEKGTHRLVRLSPFNANNKRQTSFAAVETVPIVEMEDLSTFEIPESELDITTMRSGGKGGQNVNKVETGVRIQHIPTGIAVKCTQERSQARNKDLALKMLKEKLLVIMEEQQAKELKEIRGDMVEASWGQQIRNYVFHPYKIVKDVRTGAETSQVQDVMDGDIDIFVSAYLKNRSLQAH